MAWFDPFACPSFRPARAGRTIELLLDNDESGRQGTKEIAARLLEFALVRSVSLPEDVQQPKPPSPLTAGGAFCLALEALNAEAIANAVVNVVDGVRLHFAAMGSCWPTSLDRAAGS